MLVGLIVACEIGFWVFVLAGLVARYLLRRQRLGAFLLGCAPAVDLVLLVASVADLRNGAVATSAHGLAAAYLGFSVAFGRSTIRWADGQFAYRFAGGPKPRPAPRYGAERTRHEWRLWGKAVVAWAVASALLLSAIVLVDDPSRTSVLSGWITVMTTILAIWFVAWPLAFTLWPKRPSEGSDGSPVTRSPACERVTSHE